MESIHDVPVEEQAVSAGASLHDVIEKTEKLIIERTLKLTKWNRSRTSEILGISRKALYRKIKKYESESHDMGENAQEWV